MMVMCMRVRLAMCLANICRHSDCFRCTLLTDLGDRSVETDNIDPHSCSGNKGEKFLLPEQKWIDGDVRLTIFLANTRRHTNYFKNN